ncbi:MAG: glycosyltransferase [Oscillospiraceae bacterium]|nr:glycosyltransferase [Oscillospiraceae bacterium]
MLISVVLLAYKEAENLEVLLPQIKEILQKERAQFELLIIDTEQKLDNTDEVCARHGARYVNQRYPHFGGAFRTGIEEARGDVFLILDSDGSHDPKFIPSMLAAFGDGRGVDVVIGSRYTKGGVTHDDRTSILMSRLLNGTFRLVLGIRARDVSTDFRLYKTAYLKEVQLSCENYDVLEEVLLLMRLKHRDLVIREVPITFNKRMFGESKRRLLPFILSYIRTLFRLLCLRIRAEGRHHG